MSITCSVCGFENNPDGSEYCDACGAELAESQAATPSNSATIPQTIPTAVIIPDPAAISAALIPAPVTIVPQPYSQGGSGSVTTARLIPKQPNAPEPEYNIDGNAIIGVFDPDSGPVDIDLDGFIGNETISRNHAEVFNENGVWKIKDLGSTNGVFIKAAGQTRFSARITAPTVLNDGDEVAIAKVQFQFKTP
jgi:pSer/pThr/pTyr-binding forkhead associated (FHA) protein